MTIPYRARLPFPLPENLVTFPGSLDLLRLNLGFRGVAAEVESEATGAVASLADALADRALFLTDPSGEVFEVPVTPAEAAALAAYVEPVRAWTKAFDAGDRAAMMGAYTLVRAVPEPLWLTVNVLLPARSTKAAICA